jgi:cysteine desulfurase
MEKIYLDNISGTPLHPQVKSAMIDYIEREGFGNPSSQHSLGDRATQIIENAREEVARLINASPKEIIFTSCGTESINHAIKGVALAKAGKGKHIITSNIEHNAVLRSFRMLKALGYHMTSIPVDRYGLVDPRDVEKAIRPDTILVSIMHANNEIGTIEPISEISKITREKGITFHCDAVASAGVIPIDVDEMGVDLLSIAANQFYGPSGVGALYIRSKTEITPLLHGGVQENLQRAGTHNMIGIVGMGKAAELARKEMPERRKHLLELRKAFLNGLNSIEDIIINGHPTMCLPHLVSVSIRYVEGESMMLMLDEEGIYVSTRSACATGSLRASHVLLSTGMDYADAQGTLVFSFGITNTLEHIDRALAVLKKTVDFLRNMSPLYQKKRGA